MEPGSPEFFDIHGKKIYVRKGKTLTLNPSPVSKNGRGAG
jgi:hypothetical protein